MDEQTLIVEESFSFFSIFDRLIHRFKYGNAPYNPSGYINQNDFSSIWGLSFESHPGPINKAIIDSKNMNKSLFTFIYCLENPLTQKFISIFSQPSVSNEIKQNFIFLPLDVTTLEGLTFANSLEYHSLPLIALIRPKGTTLEESQVFVKHEGMIGESILLSYIRVEHRDIPNEIEQQNQEYDIAIQQENERLYLLEEQERIENEKKQKELNNIKQIEEDFNNLPDTSSLNEKITIKFLFPNKSSENHSFPKDSPIKFLFIFVRKFMYPSKFTLTTGIPPITLEESDLLIKDICNNKNFIVYVQTTSQ